MGLNEVFMKRIMLIVCTCASLASCAKPSSLPPLLTPDLCTKPEPEPVLPDGAGIVQPVTDEERAASRLFLAFVGAALDWGREGWRQRQEAARQGCKGR